MAEINRWWHDDPQESAWLEITDRDDLGTDLNAPQRKDNGDDYWSYSLIKEIAPGDIVFHYHKPRQAIVAWSAATGAVWADTVVWGARGTTARSADITPYARDGWRLGLEDFAPLVPEVTLEDLRAAEPAIRAARAALASRFGGSLYFPFEVSDKRPLRTFQGYLVKVPRAIVKLFEPLRDAATRAEQLRDGAAQPAASIPMQVAEVGATYRVANEDAVISQRDPFAVDPAVVERGLRGHAATQNQLAKLLTQRGLTPLSHRPGEPSYDLLWRQGGALCVAEVKSLTKQNEEKQLRLGLGQLLRYRQLLEQTGAEVRAILVAERQPTDHSWDVLCSSLGIALIWPANMAERLAVDGS